MLIFCVWMFTLAMAWWSGSQHRKDMERIHRKSVCGMLDKAQALNMEQEKELKALRARKVIDAGKVQELSDELRELRVSEVARADQDNNVKRLVGHLARAVGFAFILLVFSGCDESTKPLKPKPPRVIHFQGAPLVETPVMNLPVELRTRNWAPYGQGSCVHASTVMCLRWQGLFEMADRWKRTYHSGETMSGLLSKLNANGLTYAYTSSGDPAFLEWATRTRRGAVIFYYPSHSICFVGFHGDEAWLLDNNRPGQYIREPKQTFIHNWRSRYSGFAMTPVYSPTPPLMWAGR